MQTTNRGAGPRRTLCLLVHVRPATWARLTGSNVIGTGYRIYDNRVGQAECPQPVDHLFAGAGPSGPTGAPAPAPRSAGDSATAAYSPRMPCGRNIRKRITSTLYASWRIGAAIVSLTVRKRSPSGSSTTTTAPTSLPRQVPAPPTMTSVKMNTDSTSVKLSGKM